MTQDDLDLVVSRTRHERYRWLASDDNPDASSRGEIRSLVSTLAAKFRHESPEAEYPPLLEQIANAAKAAVKFVASGCETAGQAEFDRRLSICEACDQYDAKSKRCRICGCKTAAKLRMASERCPLPEPKW